MEMTKPINIMSVCYSDRAIAWDKVWNPNVKIQDTAQSPSLSPFATLGDLSALQKLKVKVERDKLYTFAQIVVFYNKKHNIPHTYTLDDGKKILNRHNINRLGNNFFGRAVKKLGINLRQGDTYNGRNIYSISLNQWEAIRNQMYNLIQAHTNQKWRDHTWQNEIVGNGKKHTKIKIFDYFFNHIKEYETEQLYQKIQVQNALYNLFDTPDSSETNYIAHRIFKNKCIMQFFLERIGEVFFFNRKFSEYRKDRQSRQGQRLVQVSKTDVKILKNSHTGKGFDICSRSVIILTMRQLKATLVLMEYFYDMFLTGNRAQYLEAGIRNLKKFLANQQEWEQRYQVQFVENKVYRSLWI